MLSTSGRSPRPPASHRPLADAFPVERKQAPKGFFGHMWEAVKSPFTTAVGGLAVGAADGSGKGYAWTKSKIGGIAGGLIGAVVGLAVGLVLGVWGLLKNTAKAVGSLFGSG